VTLVIGMILFSSMLVLRLAGRSARLRIAGTLIMGSGWIVATIGHGVERGLVEAVVLTGIAAIIAVLSAGAVSYWSAMSKSRSNEDTG